MNTIFSQTAQLSNGVFIPRMGLGTYKVTASKEMDRILDDAYEAGYRHIDTASLYKNEKAIGSWISSHGVRSELFLTTKVWIDSMGYEGALDSFQRSLDALQTDYLDLYLIHWPKEGLIEGTWRAFEELYRSGKVKAIGVSNFRLNHLELLRKSATIFPMVDQVEMHPYYHQKSLRRYAEKNDMVITAWRPLGTLRASAVIRLIGTKYKKSDAQVALRWGYQKGAVLIPKTTHKERMVENSQILDFALSPEEEAQIDAIYQIKFGPEPDVF